MKKLSLLILIAALRLEAGESIPIPETGWSENFNSFEGTHASLPAGMSVSKDGANAMTADDSDFRGINDGNVTAGGCYAWDVSTNDYALGYQPTSDEFTPGWFRASFSNSSDRTYRFLNIKYDIVCLNNEDRSSSLRLMVSMSSTNSVSPAALTFTSSLEENVSPLWSRTTVKCWIQLPRPAASSELFTIYWLGDDNGGSGSRDEYGIDNIKITGISSRGTVIQVR